MVIVRQDLNASRFVSGIEDDERGVARVANVC